MIALKSYIFFSGLILLLYCSITVCAQNIPDSFRQKLSTAINDSAKGIILLETGESMEQISPEKSMQYYKQALALGKQIKNNRLIYSSLMDVGICFINLNKMDSAILFLKQAIPVVKLLNDTVRLARVLANIGNVYLHKKDRITAIDYYFQSATIWESSSDHHYLSIVYANINGLLNEQKEYVKALEYGNKAITLSQKIGDKNSEINGLINTAITYGLMGEHDKEYELLAKALPMATKSNDLDQVASVYHHIGDYYFKKNNFASSLKNYLESYSYAKKMGNKYHLCSITSVIAKVYHKLHQNDKALQYIIEAEKTADEVGTRTDFKEIFKTRAEIEHEAGNYKLASDYYAKAIINSDSLFQTETSEKVAEVEARYQNEKKQKEITGLEKDRQIQSISLQQKSTLNNFLIASLAALILVGFLGFRNLRHRQQLSKQQDEMQQQKISALEKDKQLVAVDSMLKGQEDERSRLAKDLHDGLGGLLSGVKFSLSNMKDNLIITPDNMTVFERSLDMLDTSIKELRRVAHNMMPEMLTKFGLDEALKEYCNTINSTQLLTIKYQSFGMETRLENTGEIIIYRIVQELLNNIMKHSRASEAFVQLIREEDRLNIGVEDNGKGFDIALLKNNRGAGLTNIQSRVDYLKGKLDINSKVDKGTLVNIEFNLKV